MEPDRETMDLEQASTGSILLYVALETLPGMSSCHVLVMEMTKSPLHVSMRASLSLGNRWEIDHASATKPANQKAGVYSNKCASEEPFKLQCCPPGECYLQMRLQPHHVEHKLCPLPGPTHKPRLWTSGAQGSTSGQP